MHAARPRPKLAHFEFEPVPHSRADLVRFFAWGYLTRRELNERLRVIEPRQRRRTRTNGTGVPTAA